MNPEPQRVVILGATSSIAEASARLLAGRGCSLVLLARNEQRLETIAQDLRLRGAADVKTRIIDLATEEDKAGRLLEVERTCGAIDALLVFYGVLGDQATASSDLSELESLIQSNFTSVAQWVTASLPLLERSTAESPVVLVVSSVAGDRGRRSNYVYGSAKAGLSTFMQGVAHDLASSSRIRAVVIKLGMVRTAMTAHLDTSGALWSDREDAARLIVSAMSGSRSVVYVPGWWRVVMLAVRSLPEVIFRRLNF